MGKNFGKLWIDGQIFKIEIELEISTETNRKL